MASDDGIDATVMSIDTAYAESLAAISKGNTILASFASVGSSAGDTIMGGKTAHKKCGADYELNNVDDFSDSKL